MCEVCFEVWSPVWKTYTFPKADKTCFEVRSPVFRAEGALTESANVPTSGPWNRVRADIIY